MKKLFLVLFVLMFIFAGCGDGDGDGGGGGGGNGNDNEDNSDVIGLWAGTYSGGDVELTINNSTWVLVHKDTYQTTESFNGTWTRNGGVLTLTVNDSFATITASLSQNNLILTIDGWLANLPQTVILTKGSSGPTGTTLTITNNSFTEITNVVWQGINFTDSGGAIGPGGSIERNVTVTNDPITGHIFFNRIGSVVAARTQNVVTVEANQNITFNFTDNTVIVEANNPDNSAAFKTFYSVHLVIGDEGPGGGMIFFAEGNQFKETSGELGARTWDSAVAAAGSFTGGGFTDWRLPDRGELDLMFHNLHRKGLGGFHASSADTSWYWSSEEESTIHAWGQRFWGSLTVQDFWLKSENDRTRAVRSFSTSF